MRTPGACLLTISLLAAAIGLAKRVYAAPCMGTDQSSYVYIFSSLNNTDYRAPIASFSEIAPTFEPMNYERSSVATATITGTCVTSEANMKLYVVGGAVVYPPTHEEDNGISVFDLRNGTWQSGPVLSPVSPLSLLHSSPSRYLITVADWSTNTYLILFDTTTGNSINTTWWFVNVGLIDLTPVSISIPVPTGVASNFTSIVYLAQRIHIFGAGSVYSLDPQPYFTTQNTTLSIDNDTAVTVTPGSSMSSSGGPGAKIPQTLVSGPTGPGEAVAFGDEKIALLSYSSNSVIVFDTVNLNFTAPIQYTATATSTDDFKDATLIPFNSTSLLLYTGASNDFSPINFAILDSSEHWHSSSAQGSNNGETPSASLPTSLTSSPCSDALCSSSAAGPPLGPIIGGVVGGIALVAAVVCLIFFLRRGKNIKRRRHLPRLNVDGGVSDGEGNYDPDDRTYTPHDRKSPTDDSLELGPPIMTHAVQQPLMMNSMGRPNSIARNSVSSATIATSLSPVTYMNNGTDAIIPSIAPPAPPAPVVPTHSAMHAHSAMPSATYSASSAAIGKRPSKSRGAAGMLGSLAVAKSVNQILDHFERGIEAYAQPDYATVDPYAPADTVILGRFRLTGDPASQPHPYVITRTASDLQNLDRVTIRFFATTPRSSYIFRKDAAVLHYLESPHIVVLLSSYELPQQHPYRHINVTEFCPMSLEQMMSSDPGVVGDPFFLKLAVKSMLGALQWVQSKGIVHLDVAPRSFYHEPGDTTTWKLAEFASARVVDAEDVDWSTMHLSRFSAPELLLVQPGAGGPRVTAAMDMWSIGATIYEMYTKKQLFSSVEEAKEKCAQFPPEYVVDVDNVESRRVLTLLRGLLAADPKLRIDIDEAVITWEREEMA